MVADAVALVAGVHYPRDWDQFSLWFPDDAACLDYLEWLRWPDGFVCFKCGGVGGWRGSDQKWNCKGCKTRTSVRAGTIFDRSKVPLTTWFAAAWYVTNQKNGASALGVQRVTGVAYQTAWTMLHKLRAAMVRPGRDLLSGTIEVDESFIGGVKPGKRGRGAAGKAMVVIAIETNAPERGYGRVRMEAIDRAEAVVLLDFIRRNVEVGTTVLTDGLTSYSSLPAFGYPHEAINIKQSGRKAHELLPGVHRAASLVKRWLLGTHQGAVPEGASAELPQRVLLPVQPSQVRPARTVVLPATRTRRDHRTGHLRRHSQGLADAQREGTGQPKRDECARRTPGPTAPPDGAWTTVEGRKPVRDPLPRTSPRLFTDWVQALAQRAVGSRSHRRRRGMSVAVLELDEWRVPFAEPSRSCPLHAARHLFISRGDPSHSSEARAPLLLDHESMSVEGNERDTHKDQDKQAGHDWPPRSRFGAWGVGYVRMSGHRSGSLRHEGACRTGRSPARRCRSDLPQHVVATELIWIALLVNRAASRGQINPDVCS